MMNKDHLTYKHIYIWTARVDEWWGMNSFFGYQTIGDRINESMNECYQK